MNGHSGSKQVVTGGHREIEGEVVTVRESIDIPQTDIYTPKALDHGIPEQT